MCPLFGLSFQSCQRCHLKMGICWFVTMSTFVICICPDHLSQAGKGQLDYCPSLCSSGLPPTDSNRSPRSQMTVSVSHNSPHFSPHLRFLGSPVASSLHIVQLYRNFCNSSLIKFILWFAFLCKPAHLQFHH